MKKIVFALLFALSVNVRAEIQGVMPIDKWAHFFMGSWIGDFARDSDLNMAQSIGLMYVIGSIKEEIDRSNGGQYNHQDIIAGCSGVVFTFAIDDIFNK